MRSLPFFKFSPGGNPTLLFVARLGVEEQARVASQCLDALHLDGEQAGFVHPEKAELRMAGGEFCLNATRCLGLALALEGRLPALPAVSPVSPVSGHGGHDKAPPVPPRQWRGKARTSGLPGEVSLHVHARNASYDCAVDIPLPSSLSGGDTGQPTCAEVETGMTLVRLPGISHLLIDATRHPFPQDWRTAAARLRARHRLDEEDAAGCIWWTPENGPGAAPAWSCTPVVAVRHPHTVCLESACGSGSLALALAQRHMLPQGRASIMQPSGMPIHVSFHEADMEAGCVRVSGPVRLVARGEAFVTLPPEATDASDTIGAPGTTDTNGAAGEI